MGADPISNRVVREGFSEEVVLRGRTKRSQSYEHWGRCSRLRRQLPAEGTAWAKAEQYQEASKVKGLEAGAPRPGQSTLQRGRRRD